MGETARESGSIPVSLDTGQDGIPPVQTLFQKVSHLKMFIKELAMIHFYELLTCNEETGKRPRARLSSLDIVLYQAGQAHSVKGRGAILFGTRIVKITLKL